MSKLKVVSGRKGAFVYDGDDAIAEFFIGNESADRAAAELFTDAAEAIELMRKLLADGLTTGLRMKIRAVVSAADARRKIVDESVVGTKAAARAGGLGRE